MQFPWKNPFLGWWILNSSWKLDENGWWILQRWLKHFKDLELGELYFYSSRFSSNSIPFIREPFRFLVLVQLNGTCWATFIYFIFGKRNDTTDVKTLTKITFLNKNIAIVRDKFLHASFLGEIMNTFCFTIKSRSFFGAFCTTFLLDVKGYNPNVFISLRQVFFNGISVVTFPSSKIGLDIPDSCHTESKCFFQSTRSFTNDLSRVHRDEFQCFFFPDVSEIDHRRGYCIVSEPFCCRFVGRKQPIDVFRTKKNGKQLRITKENPSRDDQQSSNHNKNPGIYHLTMETPWTSWHWIFFGWKIKIPSFF